MTKESRGKPAWPSAGLLPARVSSAGKLGGTHSGSPSGAAAVPKYVPPSPSLRQKV